MRIRTFALFLALTAVSMAEEPAVNLASIDATLATIAVHAKNYPPRFSSAAERQSVEARLREAIAALDAAVVREPDNQELLLRDGFANSMGHNLDFDGCAKRSAAAFEHLLALAPEDKKANLFYGAFLGGTGRAKESLEYLTKALELGATEASFSLAIAYLMLEDKERALGYLRTYVSLYPNDEGAKKLLAGLESKDVRFERKNEPPGKRPANRRKRQACIPKERGHGWSP